MGKIMAEKHLILSTGKSIYCNRGIIGLCPDGWVYEGYDGTILQDGEDEFPEDFPLRLTHAERVELADIMLTRWQEFRQRWLDGTA